MLPRPANQSHDRLFKDRVHKRLLNHLVDWRVGTSPEMLRPRASFPVAAHHLRKIDILGGLLQLPRACNTNPWRGRDVIIGIAWRFDRANWGPFQAPFKG